MKRFTRYAIGTILVLGMSSAWAQQRDLEVTMDVVPANASAGAAGEIKLPFALPDTGLVPGAGSLGLWPGDLGPGSRQGGSQRPRVRTNHIRGGANAGQAGQGKGP